MNEERNEGLYLNFILLPSYSNQDESGAYRVVEMSKLGLSYLLTFMYNNQFRIH